jgi:hypothetical protein
METITEGNIRIGNKPTVSINDKPVSTDTIEGQTIIRLVTKVRDQRELLQSWKARITELEIALENAHK